MDTAETIRIGVSEIEKHLFCFMKVLAQIFGNKAGVYRRRK